MTRSGAASWMMRRRSSISLRLKPGVGSPYSPPAFLRVSTTRKPASANSCRSSLTSRRLISLSRTPPAATPGSTPPCPASSTTVNPPASAAPTAAQPRHIPNSSAASTAHVNKARQGSARTEKLARALSFCSRALSFCSRAARIRTGRPAAQAARKDIRPAAHAAATGAFPFLFRKKIRPPPSLRRAPPKKLWSIVCLLRIFQNATQRHPLSARARQAVFCLPPRGHARQHKKRAPLQRRGKPPPKSAPISKGAKKGAGRSFYQGISLGCTLAPKMRSNCSKVPFFSRQRSQTMAPAMSPKTI